MAFKKLDLSSRFEQAEPQGSAFDSILPILMSIVGKAGAKRQSAGTGSLVDTYLNVSGSTPSPCTDGKCGGAEPLFPGLAAAVTPSPQMAPNVQQPPVLPPSTASVVKRVTKGCRIDPRTGKVV